MRVSWGNIGKKYSLSIVMQYQFVCIVGNIYVICIQFNLNTEYQVLNMYADFFDIFFLKNLYPVFIFRSPCQRQCELLPSLGVHRPLTFHILIFSSETAKPIDLKFCRKHLWKVLYKDSTFPPDPLINIHGCHRQFLFLIG